MWPCSVRIRLCASVHVCVAVSALTRACVRAANPLCMKRLSEFLLSAIQLQYKKRGAAQRSTLDDASTLLLAVRDSGDDAYVVSGMVREQSGSSRKYVDVGAVRRVPRA